MKVHESREDYLETILILKKRNGNVRSIDVANEMGFSRPSVSRAIKLLKEKDFIEVSPSGLITLTEKGIKKAEDIYERHIVLTDFFKALGIEEITASQDACRMEHVISKETFSALKEHACKFIGRE